eukprot:gnl/MRDRNA2_/MRDRNA2_306593_c0_seq1.p1 gnl/MRDRNA2_/MRDRNA2_306593_c0~~gnl/MRDRNA2_/MRDRNA2_306593_c0_seq1.p1  ORF type:complete len:173 (+),score=39.48 gnl/MRDRNA2_/MRDRNA2_306593_c0_seq1:49-519(+)
MTSPGQYFTELICHSEFYSEEPDPGGFILYVGVAAASFDAISKTGGAKSSPQGCVLSMATRCTWHNGNAQRGSNLVVPPGTTVGIFIDLHEDQVEVGWVVGQEVITASRLDSKLFAPPFRFAADLGFNGDSVRFMGEHVQLPLIKEDEEEEGLDGW